jgi:hypothetical protein
VGTIVFLSAGAWAGNSGRTVISDVPWDPTGLTNEKIIYGADDRLDVYQESDALRLQLSKAVASLMAAGRVVDNEDGTFTIQSAAYLHSGLPACPDEPFADQPTAAFCTGFLVGPDLIATAGHCYDSGDLAATRFVFGFEMEDETTPVLTVDASQVYQGIEVVGHALDGTDDYAVIRVDRDVTAPGAWPLEIRRSEDDADVAVDTLVGVMGHPSGLPQKIAFGDETKVRDISAEGHFSANLDTYGGNSGSPVFNAASGVVEGILVRGQTDFVVVGDCFESNALLDTAEDTEDVSRTTRFEDYVPSLETREGRIAFDESGYACADTIIIRAIDSDLAGLTLDVTVISSNGDSELVTLAEAGTNTGRFQGTLTIDTSAVASDGVLNVIDDATITGTYNDADDGSGDPAVATALAITDCDGPPEFFTEVFNAGAPDLDYTTMFFTPDGSSNYYRFCTTAAADFPTDPAGGTSITLQDDSYRRVLLSDDANLPFYGTSYSAYYIGSNGFITFSEGDTTFDETLSSHFALPRIAALFDDLSPNQGGTVKRQQLADRVAVTYEDIPQYNAGDSSSFQIEMFFDGRISITHLAVAAGDGIVGLSQGLGEPSGFVESDLSGYTDCSIDVVWVDFFHEGPYFGSEANPFATLADAVAIVRGGGTIKFSPGSTSIAEVIRIDMTVTLEAGEVSKIARRDIPRYAESSATSGGKESYWKEGASVDSGAITASDGGSTSGADGLDSALAQGTYERALPFTRREDGLRVAAGDAAVALRLRSDSAIDTQSLWVAIPDGYSADDFFAEWRGADDGEIDDIWLVYAPVHSWVAGSALQLTAGGTTVAGEALATTFTYHVESDEERAARVASDPMVANQPQYGADYELGEDAASSAETGELVVREVSGGAIRVSLPGGVGRPVHAGPERVFDSPQRVWLPIPDGANPGDVEVYYYHVSEDEGGWYLGARVDGWLVPNSFLYLDSGGVSYLGFQVRHGGIAQLALPKVKEK